MKHISYIFALTLLSLGSVFAQSSPKFFSSEDGDSLVSFLVDMADASTENVLSTSQKIQTQALRRNDSVLFAKALSGEAQARFNLGQISTAISKANQALSIFETYRVTEGLLTVNYQLGIIESYSGNFYGALLKLGRAMTLSKQVGDKTWRSKILYQIALINYRQGEMQLAWERSELARNQIVENAQFALKSKLLSLQALLYLEGNETAPASDLLSNARGSAVKSRDSIAFERVYATSAILAMKRGNLPEAEGLLLRAIRISSKMGNPCIYALNQLALAKVYLELDDKAKALEAAGLAHKRALELDNMALLERNAVETLAEVYLSQGDSAKALNYVSRAKFLDESVLNDEVNKFVLLPGQKPKASTLPGDTEDRGETETSDGSGSVLANDRVSLIIIGALLLLCALLTIAFIRKREPAAPEPVAVQPVAMEEEEVVVSSPKPTPVEAQNGKPTEAAIAKEAERQSQQDDLQEQYSQKLRDLEYQLLEQRRKTQEKEQELDDRNKHFEEMDKTKNKVFSVLTHDLRQPINQIKSVLNLLEMEQLDGEDRQEIVEKLKESVDNSSNALENLLLWSKKQLTGINTRIVDVHLLPQVWQLESHLKPNLESKKLKLVLNIPDFFKVKADMNQLDICLRNLLTNAIKFSKPGGKITIDAIEENGQKIVRVIDQGVGMTADQLENLKKSNNALSTMGTMNEKGTGLGIMITKEFMENQQGKLDIVSRKGEGSIFSLIFSSGTASRSPYQSELEKL